MQRAMSRCVCAKHIHACTRTAQPGEPGDGRRFSVVAMATQPPSDGEEKRYDFLEGQSQAEQRRSHDQRASSSLPFSSLFISLSSLFPPLCVPFVLFSCVCVYLIPPPCLFTTPIVSPLERWLGDGCQGVRLRCHLRIKDEAAEAAAHCLHTFISNLLMWCL